MTKEVGLWVDHRRAFIVTIENEKEVVREVKSNIDKHVRFSNGSGADGPNNHLEPTADDMRDRQFGDHLNGYYDGIISFVRKADSIWIFGPGEAKVELENRLIKGELGARIIGIETVDKMTDHQILAKVRGRFMP